MLIALLAAAAASAAPVVVQNPDWLKKPDMAQVRAVFPTEAMRNGISGQVELSCTVNVHGLLENCGIVSETPTGMGFAAAALSLTPNFQLRPGTRNGQPTPASVNIPIRFVSRGAAGSLVDMFGQEIVIANPIWRSAPSFADVAAAYPARAEGAGGFVVLRCRVWVDGGLTSCSTLTEEPQGRGLDRAARSLVGRFRLETAPGTFKSDRPIYTSVRIRLVDPKTADFQNRRVGDPTWIAVPDAATLAAAFPAAAATRGVKSGQGVVECVADVAGALTKCSSLPGDPEGLGFSEAAAKVASGMRMNPWTDDGGPVDGATIRLPIRFNLAPAAQPPARSP